MMNIPGISNSINTIHKIANAAVNTVAEKVIHPLRERLENFFACIHGIKNSNDTPTLLNKNAVFSSIATSTEREKMLATIDADVELANYPYRQDVNLLTKHAENWRLNDTINHQLMEKLSANFPGLEFSRNKSVITDKSSGLVFSLFHNKENGDNGEVRLVFGGSSSGTASGGLAERSVRNARNTAMHWAGNAKNAVFGGIPESYNKASQILKTLLEISETPLKEGDSAPGFTVSVSGHSKGAGEAAYAAIKNYSPGKEAIKATCFCTAEFGRGIQSELLTHFKSEESVIEASKGVRHCLIAGDKVPEMSQFFSKLTNVGTSITLNSQVKGQNHALGRHDKFAAHVHGREFVAAECHAGLPEGK